MKHTEETKTAEEVVEINWDFPVKDQSYAQIETANIIVLRRQQAELLKELHEIASTLDGIALSLHLISNQLIALEQAGLLPVIREQRQQAKLVRKNRLLQQKLKRYGQKREVTKTVSLGKVSI